MTTPTTAAPAETTDARNWRLLRQCIAGKIASFEAQATLYPALDYAQWAEGLRHAQIMMDTLEGEPARSWRCSPPSWAGPAPQTLAVHTAAACDAITAASHA